MDYFLSRRPTVHQSLSFSCIDPRLNTKSLTFVRMSSRPTSSVGLLPTLLGWMSWTSIIISVTLCSTAPMMGFIGMPWPIAAWHHCCCCMQHKHGEWSCPVQWALWVRKEVNIHLFFYLFPFFCSKINCQVNHELIIFHFLYWKFMSPFFFFGLVSQLCENTPFIIAE